MPTRLQAEIDAITADRIEVERENPGFFWDDQDGGRKLSREEALVSRMISVWEAWFAFLGIVEPP
jgi:hypothetical protein